jgi:uncharacterized membrane protein
MELFEGKATPSLEVALMAILAAVYAIGTIVLAPISFLAIQVRVTDALIPLAFYLKRPAVAGVTIGNIIANMFSPFGIIDIIVGTVANFIAAGSCMYVPERFWYLVGIIPTLVIGLLVGTELAFFLGLELWLVFVIEVLLGSFVAIVILGTFVLAFVTKAFPQLENAFPRWR